MKALIKQYLDQGITRRQLLTGLGTFGFSAAAARSMARSLEPALAQQATDGTPSWAREMRGTGGALLVAQLKAAGINYVFFNPSSGHAPFLDALVDQPDLHIIHALQEGAVAAMADGYAKASRKPAFAFVAHPGMPNALTQVFNSWKDHTPVVVAVDYTSLDGLGQDGLEATDHLETMAQPITKWSWMVQSAEKIPEITRRAFKFATTVPCGPVFLAFPSDTLRNEAKTLIMDQAKFDVPMKIRPDKDQIERFARMLVEAKNPLLFVGDELTWCGAQKEAVELAELLGVPVSGATGNVEWSKPFPNRHPLYVGNYFREMRYPGPADLIVNLGSRLPSGERMPIESKLVQVRLDPTNLARTAPTELGIVADLKLALVDLIAAVKSVATEARLKQLREPRAAKTKEFTTKMWALRQDIARGQANDSPISISKLALDLEAVLDRDACYVADVGSGRKMENLISFAGADKEYFQTSGDVLGYGLPASFGVKLARPDQQVVSVLGDGGVQFSGLQPLWSFARYKAPVIVVIMNNNSYNEERNRIWNTGGRQFQTGRDMACYLGDPDIDYTKAAAAYGVEGEVVTDVAKLRPALDRAKKATIDGRPYLLDVHLERGGLGAASTWHPPFSIAALRKRNV